MFLNSQSILIGLFFFGLSVLISSILRSKFRKFSSIPIASGLSGQEVAIRMLRDYGIYDVRVTCVPTTLSDHYNPANKTVNLSEEVYYGRNAAAAAIAAHECGHAVQHATGYSMLGFRSTMVPFLTATGFFMHWIILIGVLLVNLTPLPLLVGIGLFGLTTLFSFVTLPVEFDASKRALAWIQQGGVVGRHEIGMSREILWWAASTYVIAALGSLAQLMQLISIYLNRRD